MVGEEITQLFGNTHHNNKIITSTTKFHTSLEPSRIFQLNITKPNRGTLLLYRGVDIPPITRPFYNQHATELRNNLKHV